MTYSSDHGFENTRYVLHLNGATATLDWSFAMKSRDDSYENQCIADCYHAPYSNHIAIVEGSGGASGVPAALWFNMADTGEYSFGIDAFGAVSTTVPGMSRTTMMGCSSYSDSVPQEVSPSSVSDLVSGVSGFGNADPEADTFSGTISEPWQLSEGGYHAESLRTLTWNFSRKPDDLEIIVEIADYEQWRPKGNVDEKTPGSSLPVRAHLRRKDGKHTEVRARTFRFVLEDSSNIVGVAMNWPPKEEATRDYDLQFLPERNPELTITGERRQVAETQVEAQWATAVVSSFDWGAHGTLRVEAETTDGRRLVGRLAGSRDAYISLPKRQVGSAIADTWRKRPGVGLLPDDSDREPAPDGHTGDGLTLFEEYRGFRVGGQHEEGDPEKLDYFLVNKVGKVANFGIELFAAAAKVTAHAKLKHQNPPEVAADRSINFNTAGMTSRHRMLQYAVIMLREGERRSFCHGIPGKPFVPAHVQKITIHPNLTPSSSDILFVDGETLQVDAFSSDVAHELGHSVNIKHHGTGDIGWTQWLTDDTTALHERVIGNPIFPQSEGTNSLLTSDSLKPLPLSIYVSTIGNSQHSGDERCFMRYWNAEANKPTTSSQERLYFGYRAPAVALDTPGVHLCKTAHGSFFNGDDWKPRSRHGRAAPGLGECFFKVCVHPQTPHTSTYP